jgi:hypothetical protein
MELSPDSVSVAHPAPAANRLLQSLSARALGCVKRLSSLCSSHRAGHRPIQLDPATCRDLGLSCSELGSFQAEALGLAPRTRRRVAERVQTDNTTAPAVKALTGTDGPLPTTSNGRCPTAGPNVS